MRNIPFSPPDISELEINEVVEALKSGWITTGPRTKKLEERLADYCHTPKCVCLNSATAAEELNLRVLGIGEGDEVIVPAYTYTASVSAAVHVGAKVVFIDSQPDSVEMDYDKMEAAINEKTKAIIAVDLGGIICDYDRIFKAALNKKHLFTPSGNTELGQRIQKSLGRVAVLADSAHALGAEWHGKKAGSIADFTSFSFHAVKNFTTAEGGAATWRTIDGVDNEEIYKQFQLYSLHGQSKDALAKTVKGSWELETKDRGLASIPKAATKNLVMNVQPAKLLTKYKAGLAATVNEPDDDQHYGFEWQRNDAPSNMNPYQVKAQLYEGKIIGTLNGLDPDKYYKYRPFYKADDGTLFIGEWEVFITGDVDVFFEPETHTKEASEVTGESAQLVGSWIEGTEDTEEKGFEYWPESGANTRATGENMIRVIVDGDQTTATVDGLMAGKVYGYHSYVKTASGTTYGEDKTFRTPLPGDANDNGAVDAADIVELVNAKAGHPSASFNLKNADANADGSFTEADITATADIIMKR